MLRSVLVLALLAAPGPVLAGPAKGPSKPSKVVAVSALAPLCTHVRKKSFHLPEGWSVKTVSLACKIVVSAAKRPGGKGFTSLTAGKHSKPQ